MSFIIDDGNKPILLASYVKNDLSASFFLISGIESSMYIAKTLPICSCNNLMPNSQRCFRRRVAWSLPKLSQ